MRREKERNLVKPLKVNHFPALHLYVRTLSLEGFLSENSRTRLPYLHNVYIYICIMYTVDTYLMRI